jgi:ribulose-5-phosphate 4-epimerase/fuculose-1-phosphate aldolase
MKNRMGLRSQCVCLTCCASLLHLSTMSAQTRQQPPRPKAAAPASAGLIEDLVAAYRILAAEGIFDAYGHVSVRHDRDSTRYLMARSLAPALVTAADIVEFDLDSRPVEGNTSTPVVERYIHGEIYKARPDVMAIVHCHPLSVVPFSVSSVPLRPVIVSAAFMGERLPVFKSGDVEKPANVVIQNEARGKALAQALGGAPAVLMRGHGVTLVATSVRAAVLRTYSLDKNAKVLAQAIALGGTVTYMEPEAPGTVIGDGGDRGWDFWKRRAMAKDK